MKKGFLSQVSLIFFFSIMAVSIASLLFGSGAESHSALFSLGSKGLSFDTIFQYLGFSVIVSGLSRLFFSDIIFKKMLLKWRAFIFIFLTFATVVAFIVIFKWFPYQNISEWVSFIICFSLSSAVCFTCMLIKDHFDSRKYENLLSRYKEIKSKEKKI